MTAAEYPYWIGTLPIDCVSFERACDFVYKAIETRNQLVIATPNSDFLATAFDDSEFQRSILNADLCLADGMPMVWLGRLAGIPLPSRVAGSDLIEHLLDQQEHPPLRIFFFGGPEGVAEQAYEKVNNRGTGVTAVGWHYPGYGTADEMSRPSIVQKINSCSPDFLIVSLGAKKGHEWIENNRPALEVPVISHLGAVVNFLAGTMKRAPIPMKKLGLEWIWRIMEEPHLFSRYVKDGVYLTKYLVEHAIPLFVSRTINRSSNDGLELSYTATPYPLLVASGEIGSNSLNRLVEAVERLAGSVARLQIQLECQTKSPEILGYFYFLKYRDDRFRNAITIRVAGEDFP